MTPSLLVSLSGVLLVFQVVGFVSGLSTLQSTVSRKKNFATLMLMDNQVAIVAINRPTTLICLISRIYVTKDMLTNVFFKALSKVLFEYLVAPTSR